MGIKILLADDSVTAQNMGKKILSEAGHEVVTVSNGAAAAKKISEVKPDLVLLDVFMPGYSGLELCEKLRRSADTAKLPVLLTVGRMEPYSPQEGARVKADGVIVKPFESSDLIAAVDRLAQKLKPGRAVDYSHTIRIAPPADFKDESYLPWKQEAPRQTEQPRPPEPEPQDAPRSATQIFGTKPETYEQTMRLDAKQIAALLKQAAAQNAAPEASPAPAKSDAEEFHVAPPAHPPEFHGTDTSLPAFGAELARATPGESHPASVPSYMGEYLTDHPASRVEPEAAAAIPETKPADLDLDDTVVMEPGRAPTPVKPISPDSALQRFTADSSPSVPIASAEGLDLTAAVPVPDVTIVHESALETTLQSSDAPTIVLKDPALIDPYLAATEFPTHFESSETATEVAGQNESAGAPVDEFEARLKAAMASYSEPSTELPISGHGEIGTASEAHATAEEGFEAKLESAIRSFESPAEPSGDISLETSWSTPKPSSHLEHAMNALEQSEAEGAHAFEVPAPHADVVSEFQHLEPPSIEAVSSTILKPSGPEPTPIHETDDAVIQQMREALSELPVDSAHVAESVEPASVAMAMAAGASVAPTTSPTPSGREAELEITRALAAAVGSEAPSDSVGRAESEGFSSDATPDANTLAAAVERVMKRELPNLIWKIMAELNLGKR